MDADITLNYWAVLAAGLVPMVLGMIWYAPPVFGKMWMHLAKVTEHGTKKANMWMYYLVAFISALLTSYIMAHFLAYTGSVTVTDGLQMSFWAWLGFAVTTNLGDHLWGGRSFKLYALNMAFHLITFLGMSAILVSWK